MSRYFTQPRADARPMYVEDEWVGEPVIPSLSVDGEKHFDTGLVDAKGHAIMRLQEAVGFHRPRQ